MPTESEWLEIVEAAYSEVSPRDDPEGITVQSIEVVDGKKCKAVVTPSDGVGALDESKAAIYEEELVFLSEETGTHEEDGHHVEVSLGF